MAIAIAFALVLVPALRFGFAGITLLPEHASILILGLVWLRRKGTVYQIRQRVDPTVVTILAFLVLWWLFTAASSIFVAPSPVQSMRLQAWVFANIVLACLVFALRDTLATIINTMIGLVVVYMLISLAGWVLAQSTGSLNLLVERDYASAAYRINGFFDEPNLYAGFLTLFTCILVAWRSSIDPRLAWVYLVIGSVSTYLTFTRTAWITWTVVGIALGSWMLRSNWAATTFLVIGGVAVLLMAVTSDSEASGGTPLIEATSRRLGELLNVATGTGMTRVLTIESAFVDLSQRDAWLSGFGFNSYGQMHDSGVTSYAAAYLPTLWVALIYDGGWLGASFFIMAAVLAWAYTRRMGGSLFFLSFALLTSATNNIWFGFPWVLGAILIARAQLERSAAVSARELSRPEPGLVPSPESRT